MYTSDGATTLGCATFGVKDTDHTKIISQFHTKPTIETMIAIVTARNDAQRRLNVFYSMPGTMKPADIVKRDVETRQLQSMLEAHNHAYRMALDLFFMSGEEFIQWQFNNGIQPSAVRNAPLTGWPKAEAQKNVRDPNVTVKSELITDDELAAELNKIGV